MSIIKLKKGLDIKLKGEADNTVVELKPSDYYVIKPSDFKNLTPRVVAKEGESVKVGSVIFQDKENEEIVFTSPVSGTVEQVKRGERRKILEFIIKNDNKFERETFKKGLPNDFSADEISEQLIKSGLWTRIIKRPFGVIANPKQKPKALHISTFDTAPLAPDYNFTLKDYKDEFQLGVDFLSKLVAGNIHININATISDNIFADVKNATINSFQGKHPVGNVGVQIHHTTPIVTKLDLIWTVNPQDVVFIGRLFKTGTLDLTKIIALTGHEVKEPKYIKLISGAKISDIVKDNIIGDNVRYICGNVLSGIKVEKDGFLSAFDNQLTVITEGNTYEMFGWMKPGFNKFSVSKVFFSWLNTKKKWELDTNLHGGERAFVLTGQIDKVLPMNILPMQLLKSCLADDIDMMEKLGIYEIIEEDIALCEVISETKMEFQQIIADAISLMITETE